MLFSDPKEEIREPGSAVLSSSIPSDGDSAQWQAVPMRHLRCDGKQRRRFRAFIHAQDDVTEKLSPAGNRNTGGGRPVLTPGFRDRQVSGITAVQHEECAAKAAETLPKRDV